MHGWYLGRRVLCYFCDERLYSSPGAGRKMKTPNVSKSVNGEHRTHCNMARLLAVRQRGVMFDRFFPLRLLAKINKRILAGRWQGCVSAGSQNVAATDSWIVALLVAPYQCPLSRPIETWSLMKHATTRPQGLQPYPKVLGGEEDAPAHEGRDSSTVTWVATGAWGPNYNACLFERYLIK